METQKNPMFVVVVGFIIAIGRLVFGKINNIPEDAILLIMAIVNYVALGFVLLFLHNDIVKVCGNNITKAGIDTARKKKGKAIINIFGCVFLCIYTGVGILYLLFCKTSDMNDAISIIALSISIAATGLSDRIGNTYYRLIIKLTKFKLRKR